MRGETWGETGTMMFGGKVGELDVIKKVFLTNKPRARYNRSSDNEVLWCGVSTSQATGNHPKRSALASFH